MVISELEYLRAKSRTRARPFWFTKSTRARRRSSFSTELRLFAMVAYDHIRTKRGTKAETAVAWAAGPDQCGQSSTKGNRKKTYVERQAAGMNPPRQRSNPETSLR